MESLSTVPFRCNFYLYLWCYFFFFAFCLSFLLVWSLLLFPLHTLTLSSPQSNIHILRVPAEIALFYCNSCNCVHSKITPMTAIVIIVSLLVLHVACCRWCLIIYILCIYIAYEEDSNHQAQVISGGEDSFLFGWASKHTTCQHNSTKYKNLSRLVFHQRLGWLAGCCTITTISRLICLFLLHAIFFFRSRLRCDSVCLERQCLLFSIWAVSH